MQMVTVQVVERQGEKVIFFGELGEHLFINPLSGCGFIEGAH
jgi:hypothetical protein